MIVYCRSGTRAALAASTLKTLGYENVANLDGGFGAWKDAGPANRRAPRRHLGDDTTIAAAIGTRC